jgi:hypothetical protein
MQKENDMRQSKSTLSKATSYREIGAFWDTHDLGAFWDETKPIRMSVSVETEADYYGVDHELSEKLLEVAGKRGVSVQTLVNLWLQERLATTKS